MGARYSNIQSTLTVYTHVCTGGTFDLPMHDGHKKVLSESVHRCSRRLTVGVADGPLLRNKTLRELIRPVDERMAAVREYLQQVQPNLRYDVVPIVDRFGPAATDATMQAIVATEEEHVKKTCSALNAARISSGHPPLDVVILRIIPGIEASKMSSTAKRKQKLGTQLKKPNKSWSVGDDGPYVIGLVGCSASGKSALAKYLRDLGAGVVDCDELGHSVYEPGTEAYAAVVEAFGAEVVADDKRIDRRKLGQKVFASAEDLRTLNAIAWPAIRRLAEAEISALGSRGSRVVVMDAAVLLAAGWDDMCHQVWAAILPESEAVERIIERDGKTEDEAKDRLKAQEDQQGTQQSLVDRSSVVFCTTWTPAVTRLQVERAWRGLQNIIHATTDD